MGQCTSSKFNKTIIYSLHEFLNSVNYLKVLYDITPNKQFGKIENENFNEFTSK